MSFYRNATVLDLVILVDVYPVAQGIHGDAGGMAEIIAILQSAHDDAGEDVAGARDIFSSIIVGRLKDLSFEAEISKRIRMIAKY